MKRQVMEAFYLNKRMNKRFFMKAKDYRQVVKLIREIWLAENMENCNLIINKRGVSYHSEAHFQKDNMAVIRISMSQDWHLYMKLKEAGKIHGDFLRFVKFVTLHEIGHRKDENLSQMKEERRKIRRQLFSARTLEEWNELESQVWQLTRKMEIKAWNYVHARITAEELGDLIEYQHDCMRQHFLGWKDVSRSFLPASFKKVS